MLHNCRSDKKVTSSLLNMLRRFKLKSKIQLWVNLTDVKRTCFCNIVVLKILVFIYLLRKSISIILLLSIYWVNEICIDTE